ncbi:amidohydrolase family protein [Anaerosinus sp.]|uniref:amidohydrolase family protein n=1 Tax=Selenobaculum sp. TaxID=3074374 RepID=UPI0015AA82AD
MKIIDSHIHFSNSEHFVNAAKNSEHIVTLEHLEMIFQQSNIVLGIGMGVDGKDPAGGISKPLTLGKEGLPPFLVQCLGIDTAAIRKETLNDTLDAFERMLNEKTTVGLKVYAGYQHFYVNDEIYHPFYEMAEAHDVPVVIHTGDTANSKALLKYAHPLTVDEVAVNFPRVRFVMAHYGNPWIADATEVARKNENVYVDLSGLAEGIFNVNWFMQHYEDYVNHMRMWMTYLGNYEKFIYGSDWPLVSMKAYISLIWRIIPVEYHELVFWKNAESVFSRIKEVLPKE